MEFIVLQAAEAISKTNQKYYKLTVLTLQKEKFDLFVWNPQLISKGFCFEVNDADVKDNGNKSTSFGNLSPVSDEVKAQLQALIPQPVSREEWEALRDLIAAEIDDSPICKVFIMEMNNLYGKYKEKPAASGVHQAYPGGLLNHVFLALKYLRAILNTSSLPLNKPVAFLAMLIHDHGKIYEYSEAEDGSIIVNPEYYLLGHMYMGAAYAKKLAEAYKGCISDKDLTYLIHCVLAHHDKLEWGSPVVPACFEAVCVHHADMLSARDDMFEWGVPGERNRYLGTATCQYDKIPKINYEAL